MLYPPVHVSFGANGRPIITRQSGEELSSRAQLLVMSALFVYASTIPGFKPADYEGSWEWDEEHGRYAFSSDLDGPPRTAPAPAPTTIMNVDLLRRVQQQILATPHDFDMGAWACETHRCIGGWALVLSGYTVKHYDGRAVDFVSPDGAVVDALDAARQLFGLQRHAARELMVDETDMCGEHGARVAAAAIDILIETGEVNWDAAQSRVAREMGV